MAKKTKPVVKTKVFEYKGYIGIEAGTELVNATPIGITVMLSNVEISQSAFDKLQTVRRNSSSFAPLMCFNPVLGWAGGLKAVFSPDDLEADRDYEPSLLKPQITEVEIPKEFKQFIDAETK